MKAKITGHVPTTNVNTICRRESLDKYISLFASYFDHVGNCIVDLDISNITNAVICSGRVRKLSVCSNCHGGHIEVPDTWKFGRSDPVWEHLHMNNKAPQFMRVEVDKFERRLCNNSIIISLRGGDYNRVIGEFCPHKKILLTTDWTHDDTRLPFVTKILGLMEEDGLISKRSVDKKKPNIMLGTDPELEYVDPDSGDVVNCGELGIRDRVLMSNGQGRIGHDGAGAQREIRPEPAPTPEGLIDNIDKLIKAALDEQWSLRGERYSLGGHIHIGGVDESRGFINLLDYYLKPLSDLNSSSRQNSSYGKPGDYRRQPHGIEYRTPPSAWLASKELAHVTLKIVKLAAEKHYSGDDIEIGENYKEDLVNLGLTGDEVDIFLSEIKKYKTNGLPKDLKAAWGYKLPPKFVLEFRDSWSDNVKQYIEDVIKTFAAEENLGGRVVFYGLSSDRGNVFSAIKENMEDIELSKNYAIISPVKGSKNHVGIPSIIRGNLSETERNIEVIKEIVKRTVNPPKEKKSRKKKTVAEEYVGFITPDMVPTAYYSTESTNSNFNFR